MKAPAPVRARAQQERSGGFESSKRRRPSTQSSGCVQHRRAYSDLILRLHPSLLPSSDHAIVHCCHMAVRLPRLPWRSDHDHVTSTYRARTSGPPSAQETLAVRRSPSTRTVHRSASSRHSPLAGPPLPWYSFLSPCSSCAPATLAVQTSRVDLRMRRRDTWSRGRRARNAQAVFPPPPQPFLQPVDVEFPRTVHRLRELATHGQQGWRERRCVASHEATLAQPCSWLDG